MTDTSRIEAQQRADEIRIFRRKLTRLEGEGVLRLANVQRDAVNSHWSDRILRSAIELRQRQENAAASCSCRASIFSTSATSLSHADFSCGLGMGRESKLNKSRTVIARG